MKANPKAYAQILQQANSQAVAPQAVANPVELRQSQAQPAAQISTPQGPETKAVQFVNVPGFPAYVFTGDKVADDARYQAAKDAWISANPKAYEAMHQSQPANAAQIRSQEAANGYKAQTPTTR